MLFSGKHLTLLQGCFIKYKILQSPMISHRSPLLTTIVINDKADYNLRVCGSLNLYPMLIKNYLV